MKKILLLLMFLCVLILPSFATVIVGNVSITDKVPTEFFGDWKVVSICTKSTNKDYFDTTSVDIWRLTRSGNSIILENPMSGARAQVEVNDIKGNTVKFEKKTYYPDEESLETPILTLQGDNFVGVDKISIKTFNNGKLIKEDYVEYKVKGTRISGIDLSIIFGK